MEPLFEHQVSNGFDWTDRDLVALERLNRPVELLRPVVHKGKRELLATQHVGVFRLGRRTVQVFPKMYKRETTDPDQQATEATQNLLHMLQIAEGVGVREQGLADLLKAGVDWFEILTRLFALHLREEWQRGASRGYQLVEDDSPALKGKWRIAEQLRRPGRDHLFSVAYDEFTADIPLNRVFRFVVERLCKLTRDGENRKTLGELRQWMDEVTLLPAMPASAASPALLTRLNRRMEPPLNLARLFLDGGTMQMATGDLSAFAFTFDMNRVFEGFVVNFVCRHRGEILPEALRGCELLPQTQGATRYLARADTGGVFRLKPDLAVRDGQTFRLLVDAKYKIVDGKGAGVSPGDFYQMYAYAQRYDCPFVLMIYPQTAETPAEVYREFVLEGTEGKKIVAVATVDVRQDLGKVEGRNDLVQRLKAVMSKGGV